MEHVTCQTFFRIKTIVANFPVCSKWDMLTVAWARSRWRQSQHIRWIIAIENNYALYLRSWWKKLKFISCRECTELKYFYRHLKANGMNEPDKHEIVSILYSRWSILQKWEQKYKKICPVLSVSIPGEWCCCLLYFLSCYRTLQVWWLCLVSMWQWRATLRPSMICISSKLGTFTEPSREYIIPSLIGKFNLQERK